MLRTRLTLLIAAVLLLTNVPATAAGPQRTDWKEVFSPDGTISRVQVRLPVNEPGVQGLVAAEVVPIEINGSSATHFDLVFVGDGYTSSQSGAYHNHVVGKWNEIAAFEPFKSHRTQFNVAVTTSAASTGRPTIRSCAASGGSTTCPAGKR